MFRRGFEIEADNVLQWGRRVNAAERGIDVGIRVSLPMLQWGRRVNAAEREASNIALGEDVTGFNGAAA